MTDIVEMLRHCSTNTTDEYLHELTGRAADTIEQLRARIAEAVLAEREACAATIAQMGTNYDSAAGERFAAAIRQRTDDAGR